MLKLWMVCGPVLVAAIAGAYGWRQLPMEWPYSFQFNRSLPRQCEINGVSHKESWGRWSDGSEVRLRCSSRLPERFWLEIDGHAYGPNQDRRFILRLAQGEKSFVLDGQSSRVRLAVDAAELRDPYELAVEIPLPTSPMSLGRGNDARLLGLGLHKLTITPIAEMQGGS